MDQQSFLIKLASLTDELESQGLYREADNLHHHFIKIALEREHVFGVGDFSSDEDQQVELTLQEAVDLGMLPESALEGKDPKEKSKFNIPTNISPNSKLWRLIPKKFTSPASAVGSFGASELEKKIGTDVFRGLSNKTLDSLTSKMLSGKFTDEQLKNIAAKQFQREFRRSRFQAGFKDIGKFGLVNTILNMGVDYAVDFFEDAQGPYQLFKDHLPDVKKILNIINRFVKDNETSQLSNELLQFLDDCMNELNKAKSAVKTAHNVNFRTVYNNKNTKLAIRGEFESEAPKYLRDLVQGGAIGAGSGAFFGGIGALPGAILGAGAKLLGRGAEDIWYASISNTGKAYMQSKDLEQKISRLANSFQEINPQLASQIIDLADRIMARVEKLNVDNPNKTYLENVIRHLEKKVERVTKPVSDIAKSAVGLANQESGLAEKFLGQPGK